MCGRYNTEGEAPFGVCEMFCGITDPFYQALFRLCYGKGRLVFLFLDQPLPHLEAIARQIQDGLLITVAGENRPAVVDRDLGVDKGPAAVSFDAVSGVTKRFCNIGGVMIAVAYMICLRIE